MIIYMTPKEKDLHVSGNMLYAELKALTIANRIIYRQFSVYTATKHLLVVHYAFEVI